MRDIEKFDYFESALAREQHQEFPSLDKFLDVISQLVFELKKEKKIDQVKLLLRDYKQWEDSLWKYEEKYKSLSSLQAERREKRQGKLEPADSQSLNQEFQAVNTARGTAHLNLISAYYQLVADFNKISPDGHFPWIDKEIFNTDGRLKQDFITYTKTHIPRFSTKKISRAKLKAFGKWALGEVEKLENNKQKKEEIKPYVQLLDEEWKNVNKKNEK